MEITYDKKVSLDARLLLLALLDKHQSRLGYERKASSLIKGMTFFKKTRWSKLLKKKIEAPPLDPVVSSEITIL